MLAQEAAVEVQELEVEGRGLPVLLGPVFRLERLPFGRHWHACQQHALPKRGTWLITLRTLDLVQPTQGHTLGTIKDVANQRHEVEVSGIVGKPHGRLVKRLPGLRQALPDALAICRRSPGTGGLGLRCWHLGGGLDHKWPGQRLLPRPLEQRARLRRELARGEHLEEAAQGLRGVAARVSEARALHVTVVVPLQPSELALALLGPHLGHKSRPFHAQ
mmetsp:Transcript_90943/g.253050  ORF Transcript_90943/g.253050 Transcript_90943/m.253050 type:complete len:218 (+) Transcript_90943:588-1241(+)